MPALAFPVLLLKLAAAGPGEPGEGLGTVWDSGSLHTPHPVWPSLSFSRLSPAVPGAGRQPHGLVGFLPGRVALHSMAA